MCPDYPARREWGDLMAIKPPLPGIRLPEQDPRLLQGDPHAPGDRHADEQPRHRDDSRAGLATLARAAHFARLCRLVRELALGLQLGVGHEVLVGDWLHQPVA